MLALSVEWWKAVRARVNELANKKRFEGTFLTFVVHRADAAVSFICIVRLGIFERCVTSVPCS